MFTVPTAAIFNRHADVFRSALVGLGPRGDQRPALVVEPRTRLPRAKCKQLTAELEPRPVLSEHRIDSRHSDPPFAPR